MTAAQREKALQISEKLVLPADAVTSTLVVFGGKGMGKTNFLTVVAEEVARIGQRFSIIDPMGVCWGLRHSADGKGPGIEILILGGKHGDIPIEPTAGAVVADLVVDEDVSVVIDISRRADGRSWGKNEKIRFVGDYCTRLFERQGERSRPILQIIDEAARFVPQMIRANELHTATCMGAVAQMVEEGRNVGIGVCLVSQRSARLNKDVSELADCMIAFRTVGPNSVNAVLDWLGDHVAKEKWKGYVEQLRTLPRGSALVVSPGWLEYEGVAQIRQRSTFDSSATPKAGQERKAPGKGAKPDLVRYQARMAETIEKANSDNPAALRKKIAALELQLAKPVKSVAAPAPAAKVETKVKEVPVLKDSQIGKLEAITEKLLKHAATVDIAVQALTSAIGFRTAMTDELRKRESPLPAPLPASIRPARPAPTRAAVPPADSDASLDKCQRAILGVLAQFNPAGCRKERLALLAGYSYSGGFRNALGGLRSKGFMVGENTATMSITDEGLGALGDYEPLPTGRALVEHWLSHSAFGKAERAILQFLVNNPGDGWTGPVIAAQVGYEYSGGFRNALGALRTAGVIVGKNNTGPISAAPELLG